jgi:putative methionine-R-sulfoxide reductase with GAF domain
MEKGASRCVLGLPGSRMQPLLAGFPMDTRRHLFQLSVMEKAQEKLQEAMAEFGCQTGTLHRAEGEWLHLVAMAGVPDFLLDKISLIPFGKGIAGVAASTREPVELCNLQQDLGGVAKEDARKTGVSGSLAVPILSDDGVVLGTLGVGKVTPYEFSDAEKTRLAEIGRECRDLL